MSPPEQPTNTPQSDVLFQNMCTERQTLIESFIGQFEPDKDKVNKLAQRVSLGAYSFALKNIPVEKGRTVDELDNFPDTLPFICLVATEDQSTILMRTRKITVIPNYDEDIHLATFFLDNYVYDVGICMNKDGTISLSKVLESDNFVAGQKFGTCFGIYKPFQDTDKVFMQAVNLPTNYERLFIGGRLVNDQELKARTAKIALKREERKRELDVLTIDTTELPHLQVNDTSLFGYLQRITGDMPVRYFENGYKVMSRILHTENPDKNISVGMRIQIVNGGSNVFELTLDNVMLPPVQNTEFLLSRIAAPLPDSQHGRLVLRMEKHTDHPQIVTGFAERYTRNAENKPMKAVDQNISLELLLTPEIFARIVEQSEFDVIVPEVPQIYHGRNKPRKYIGNNPHNFHHRPVRKR